MLNTCRMHGRDIRTQYIGSMFILLWRNDWSSIRLDTPSKISLKHNWMKELGSELAGSSKAIQRFHTKAKPIIKNGEFLGWAPVHLGNRERCLVWSRKHRTLNKNGETFGWTKTHPELRLFRWRQRHWRRRTRRSNWNETIPLEMNNFLFCWHNGKNTHRLQSIWIVTCSCGRSRKLRCSRTRQKSRIILIEKHFKSIYNWATSTTHSTHSETRENRWFVTKTIWSSSSYA